jgi:hypothetical protein
MSAVRELLPGDLVTNGPMSATFIAATQHPIWPDLALVIWRMLGDELSVDERGWVMSPWSHDALAWDQHVGEAAAATREDRMRRLRKALLDRSQ